MSTDDNKNTIVWKRSSQNNQQSQTTDITKNQTNIPEKSNQGLVFKRNISESNIPVMDMATQSAARLQTNDSQKHNKSINDLRAEIDGAFSLNGNDTSKKIDAPLLPITPKASSGNKETSSDSIDSLKAEIEQAFGDKEDPSTNKLSSRSDSIINLEGDDSVNSESPLLPITPKANGHKENSTTSNFMPPVPAGSEVQKESNVALDNHEALVKSLKEDIKSEFDKDSLEGVKNNKETPASIGVGQTYYSDLSKAMGANEPATMSELIKKSRFEKKESMILSPKSKRNILYIAAAVLLLGLSVGVIFSLFGSKKDPIEFTSEERVSSLVFANQDTGINVTGLESEKTKQVIRQVVEKKIPEDTINQIYYVEETPNGSIRRLGVKDIFNKTNNETPKLLYDNIDNDFTHGVYKSDKNYPFIILKALSYDRALQGMKEWEPTMLDDLATYFDLPPEATDRSLIKDGYEDDLIRNKNVRVSRYLPREVDSRGILDFLRLNPTTTPEPAPTESEQIETTNPNTGIITDNAIEVDQDGNVIQDDNIDSLGLLTRFKKFISNNLGQSRVFAQTPITGVGFSTNENQNSNTQRICYQITKSCFDGFTGQEVTFNPSDTNQICNDIRVNNIPVPSTSALEADIANYACINSLTGGDELTGGDAIGQLTTTAPICFNNQTGERLATPDATQFCLNSYRCNLNECRANGIPVQPGSPGAQCGLESTVSVDFNDPREKVCRNYSHLLNVQNINDTAVCFDNQSNYLPYNSPETVGTGFSCVLPQDRSSRLCITSSNQVVVRTGNEIFTNDQFCFEANQNATTNIGVNGQCSNFTTAEIQSRLSVGVVTLRLAAGIGQLFGLSQQDTGNLNNAADTLAQLATQNVLQEQSVRQGVLVVQTLESILDRIDPNMQLPLTGPNGGANLYSILRDIIDTVKCTLGIANNLQWTTLAQIPQGITIFAGQSLEGVEPVQQALVLIGLMDPISVNGSLDLVTQDAISQLQLANALSVTGILDPETLAFIQTIIDNQGGLFGGGSAIINDYFVIGDGALDAEGNIITGSTVGQFLTLGAYNEDVQSLQVLLFAEGFEINNINGLFDEQTCSAVQQFQQDNGLEIADPRSCTVSPETVEALNDVIRTRGFLGSGFSLGPEGFLRGVGELQGNFGPGVANFEVNQADADTLREGDIVLMYMFLDEETILIARDQIVIDEIIQRRVLSDIFQN